jgi:hypothetical protein
MTATDNAEPCYCVNGPIGGHKRTARCAQPAYPAFPQAIAKTRVNLPPKDGIFRCSICYDGLKTCSCARGYHSQPIRSQSDAATESNRPAIHTSMSDR